MALPLPRARERINMVRTTPGLGKVGGDATSAKAWLRAQVEASVSVTGLSLIQLCLVTPGEMTRYKGGLARA